MSTVCSVFSQTNLRKRIGGGKVINLQEMARMVGGIGVNPGDPAPPPPDNNIPPAMVSWALYPSNGN